MDRNKISIIPATLRDVSYIVANLCPEDRREIECQYAPDITAEQIAALHLVAGEAYVATIDGQPVEAFGVVPATWNVLVAWAFGTRDRFPAIPEMTRFVWTLFDAHVSAGVTRIEARSIAGHDAAHRWMRRMGATEVPLPRWGRNGEDFILFAWTETEWAGERGYRAVRKRFADKAEPDWFTTFAGERCG